MLIELQRIFIPFATAFLNVLAVALAIGMLPALWVLVRGRQWGLLWRWAIVTAIFVTAAVYGLPQAHIAWKNYKPQTFKPVAMYMGYFVGLLFVPMLLPEPLRIARHRIRTEAERPDEPERRVRRVRRKRRKEGIPTDLKLR